MGNTCRRLERLCNAPTNKRGHTYVGLISGLRKFLRLYRTNIVEVGAIVKDVN